MMKLENLRLEYGSPIQLQTHSNGGLSQRYDCCLIGCIPDRTVILTPPHNDEGYCLSAGQKLAVQIIVGNGIYLFGAVYMQQIRSPFPMAFLSYPSHLSFKQVRGATRVNVRLPITLKNLVTLDDLQVEGIIADISLSGARVEMKQTVGEVGDDVLLTSNISIGAVERELIIQGVIRSRVERSTREYVENLPAVYGIEFNDSNKDRLLTLHAYVYGEIARNYASE